jgi:hypothetical protein
LSQEFPLNDVKKGPTGNHGNCLQNLITGGRELTLQKSIFFGMPTHCRNDCQLPELILSQEFPLNDVKKGPTGNHGNCLQNLITGGRELTLQKSIFFGMQTHCWNDCQLPELILSQEFSLNDVKKGPTGNHGNCLQNLFYWRSIIYAPEDYIFRNANSL